MKDRLNTVTLPKARPDMASPRACLAFGALGVVARIRTSLRELHKIWNEGRNQGVDGGRVDRIPAAVGTLALTATPVERPETCLGQDRGDRR